MEANEDSLDMELDGIVDTNTTQAVGFDQNAIPISEISALSNTQSFDIHSYIFVKNNITVEESFSVRAASFYSSVKEESLRNELIADFTEMELAYFKNDTIEFSRRLHKQIEAIVCYCLFEKKGLSQLKDDFLNKKGVKKVGIDYEEKLLGEIIMDNQFHNLKEGRILSLNDSNIPLDKRHELFCYYFLNSNQKGFTSPAVFCYDYDIYNNINYLRKKGSHGWLRLKQSTQNKLLSIESSPAQFYFDALYLLRKFRFERKVILLLN